MSFSLPQVWLLLVPLGLFLWTRGRRPGRRRRHRCPGQGPPRRLSHGHDEGGRATGPTPFVMRQSSSGDAVRLGLDDDGLGRFFVFELVFDVDVGAELDDPPVHDDGDPVGVGGRVETVGHLDDSAPGQRRGQGPLQGAGGARVQQ